MTLFDNWINKRVFKIEKDRHKHKKYIFTPLTKTICHGYNSKNLYPILVSDFLSKYYRMQGQNVMFPVGYNNINEDSLNYSRLSGSTILDLKQYYQDELKKMAIGYDYEKEISYSDKNFITFIQLLFERLYNDGYIKEVNKECYMDFSNHIVVPNYRVIKDNNNYIDSITKDELHVKKTRSLALDFKKMNMENLYKKIKDSNIDDDIKNDIYRILNCKIGLKLKLYSYEKSMGIDILIDEPQLIGAITFIALNPKFIDVLPYVTEDEIITVKEYLNLEECEYDCYSGLTLSNPLTNTDILVFISYKYDEAIHVGMPFNNMLDGMFASHLGLESIDVLNDGVLQNSDFLNGLTEEEANKAIIEAFVSEGMAESYFRPCLDELIITSYDELGVLVPVYTNYKQEINILDNSHYPVYYNNRYKIFITNENTLDSDVTPTRMVFNEDFIRGISNIYCRVYEKEVGNNDFLDNVSSYDEFNDMVGVFTKDTAYIDIFYNYLFNEILKEYGHNYNGYNECVILEELKIDPRFLEEHQRLGISFVEEVINRYDSDIYRLYLFNEQTYHDDLGDTLVMLKKYEVLIGEIKNTYQIPFELGVFDNSYFDELKKTTLMLIEARQFKEYARCLIDFYNDYVKDRHLTKHEAIEYLIMLSLIIPNTAEEIFEEVFNERYSIFFSEWPK